jgi:hypothetical protein
MQPACPSNLYHFEINTFVGGSARNTAQTLLDMSNYSRHLAFLLDMQILQQCVEPVSSYKQSHDGKSSGRGGGSGSSLAVDVVLSMPFLDSQEILEGRRGGNTGE